MSTAPRLHQSSVLDEVLQVTTHVISDWELDLPEPLGPTTQLVADLDFDSIDLVCLFLAIESRYEGTKFGFEDLVMVDGEYVEDLSLAEIASFAKQRLDGE